MYRKVIHVLIVAGELSHELSWIKQEILEIVDDKVSDSVKNILGEFLLTISSMNLQNIDPFFLRLHAHEEELKLTKKKEENISSTILTSSWRYSAIFFMVLLLTTAKPMIV